MWKRHLVIIVIVFGFLFFINVDRIQAKNCNFYYVGQHDQVELGHDKVYAVKIKYTQDELVWISNTALRELKELLQDM